MLINNIRNAIWNKRMALAISLGFLCLIVGGAEILFGNNEGIDFSYMFLFSLSCGTSSLLALIYPVLACIPYADIYVEEHNSGYLLYERIKKRKSQYIGIKLVSCAFSGGIALSIPVAVYLGICIQLKGTVLMEGGMQYITHYIAFYQQHPVWYCLGYVWNAFFCGMLFSLLGLAVSAFVKNKYIVVFLPLMIYILFNIVFSGNLAKLNPTLWWDINLYSESNSRLVMFIKLAMLLLFSGMFSFGVMRNEKN